jgi:hypothetical protein
MVTHPIPQFAGGVLLAAVHAVVEAAIVREELRVLPSHAM